jgi:hypothetical protein
MRWKWTAEMQSAFEIVRAKFATSIELNHPDNDLLYCIYTNACRYGIRGILMQRGGDGTMSIISTASRVLNEAESRYSVCEQELLAVVYALQNFRLYIFGQPVTVYSSLKALSFMKKVQFGFESHNPMGYADSRIRLGNCTHQGD